MHSQRISAEREGMLISFVASDSVLCIDDNYPATSCPTPLR